MLTRLLTYIIFAVSFCLSVEIHAKVTVGIDHLMDEQYSSLLRGKKVGLITNHTAINSEFSTTTAILKAHAKSKGYELVALFAPEHGITGSAYAEEQVAESKDPDGLPIYSLHGTTKRPTAEMLKGITLLIYDIQDIGSRSYTYITSMFYAMEEAAKKRIPFVVLDRPNPINGVTIDGPVMEEKWKSMLGYINIPYCHGMTAGELARYFNGEYKIKCQLTVIPMKGWNRNMSFKDTGLPWIPTSPYVPEADTPFFYPTTGILGELRFVNIGIGYTLPFKVVGAPWIDAKAFSEMLNNQKFGGVYFSPFHYRPMYGRYAKHECHGVLIVVTDPLKYKPVSTQYLILGILKSLYPDKFQLAINTAKDQRPLICKLNGTEEIYQLLIGEKHIAWRLCAVHSKERELFAKRRDPYLLKEYSLK